MEAGCKYRPPPGLKTLPPLAKPGYDCFKSARKKRPNK